MQFLADENIGTSVVVYLRDSGHDVVWIREIGPGMSDEEVLALVSHEKRVLLTHDQDFGEIVFFEHKEHAGILLLRLSIQTPSYEIRALRGFLARHAPEDITGEFWKIDERYL